MRKGDFNFDKDSKGGVATKRRTKDEQKTVRAARADKEKTKKTSPLHIPSFRWLPPKGELQRLKDEEKTVRAARADKEKTKKTSP